MTTATTSTSSDQQPVHLRYSPNGQLTAVLIDARSWTVAEPPMRWFERRAWWQLDTRLPKGSGRGAVDSQIMQVQCRLGTNPLSQLVTFELIEDGADGIWSVRDVLQAA